jgi:peptidyl-Lys metalloendopeptidase
MNGKRKAILAMLAALTAAQQAWAQQAPTQQAPAQSSGIIVELSPVRQTLGKSDNVLVTVTLINRSATIQYLLAWQTPLAGVAAPLFDVTRDGQPVPYLGIQAKRAAPAAADYIALAPGASRSVTVELSKLYDMSVTGAYSVRYRAGKLQQFSAPGVMQGQAETAGLASAIWIDGRLPRGTLSALAAPSGPAGLATSRCSNAQQDSIAGAVQAAQAMAADGNAYMSKRALGPRYANWFGAFDDARANAIIRHFQAIGDAFATKPVTVDCGCNESYYAYVYPNQPYKIYVCNAFWSAPLTGTDSKGGTLVHEMSHFTVVAGTDDWVYGQSAAANLALSDPAKAVDNADSHEYFGENTPHQELR